MPKGSPLQPHLLHPPRRGDWPEHLTGVAAALQRAPTSAQALALAVLPAADATYAQVAEELHPDLRAALRRKGIEQLYRHQGEAFTLARGGTDVVVTTPTASGKTLCFNLPVIDSVLRDPSVKALYLYPTKALANDQLAALRELLGPLASRVTAEVFTGDTPDDERARIKSRPPNILIANPDILHYQQLADHMSWDRWWKDLRWIVIDEAHTYRGVFGAHVAHVMRRVRRIAEYYGAQPQFLAASATIANPVELLEDLTGRTPILVSEDGSPRAGRDIVVWQPGVKQVTPAGPIYESIEDVTGDLVVAAMLAGKSVIAFARARRTVERIRRDVDRQLVERDHRDLLGVVRSYRAGYEPEVRKEIERGLRAGSIRAVVSTVALELGIDIGSLDVAILSGYPGSTMSFWQQAGRAGRRGKRALVMMVASQNPLDQFLAGNPSRLVGAAHEDAVSDAANPLIASRQLTCAARELTLRRREADLFGDEVLAQTSVAVANGWMVEERRGWVPATGHGRPDEVSLRGIDGTSYVLLLYGKTIGQIESRYVPREAHEGAIYLQDGEPFRVKSVDDVQHLIVLEPSRERLLTDPLGHRLVRPGLVRRSKNANGLAVSLLGVTAIDRITEYVHINEVTKRRIGVPIPLPSPRDATLETVGVRVSAPLGILGSELHAFEHLVRSLGALVVLCDPGDLEGHTETEGSPVAYVYDRNPGGIGLAERLYDRLDEVLEAAAQRVGACECEAGCPACIQSGSCLRRNEALDKLGARHLLRAWATTPAP